MAAVGNTSAREPVSATITCSAVSASLPEGFNTDNCTVTLTPDGAQSTLVPPPALISESFLNGSATLYPIAGNYIASLACPTGYTLTKTGPTTDIVITSNAESPPFGFTISAVTAP